MKPLDRGRKSIEQLEGKVWPESEPGGTQLIKTCHRLRKKPLDEFSPNDLRLMIGQKIGLLYLMPLAIDLLERAPLIEAAFFPGDLLKCTLTNFDFLSANRDLLARSILIVRRALASLGSEDPSLTQVMSDFLAKGGA